MANTQLELSTWDGLATQQNAGTVYTQWEPGDSVIYLSVEDLTTAKLAGVCLDREMAVKLMCELAVFANQA